MPLLLAALQPGCGGGTSDQELDPAYTRSPIAACEERRCPDTAERAAWGGTHPTTHPPHRIPGTAAEEANVIQAFYVRSALRSRGPRPTSPQVGPPSISWIP